MAFRIRQLNHSPDWYDAHCKAEDGGSPAFRAMLKKDMTFLDADIDSTLTYLELIGIYRDQWNRSLCMIDNHIQDCSVRSSLMAAVILREEESGFSPFAEYKKSPWSDLDQLITQHSLSGEDVRLFLKWRAQNLNGAEARKKRKTTKKALNENDQVAAEFFTHEPDSRERIVEMVRGAAVLAKKKGKTKLSPTPAGINDNWMEEFTAEQAKDEANPRNSTT